MTGAYSRTMGLRPRGTSTGPGRSHVRTTQSLLTGAWASDVNAIEAAVARFDEPGLVTNECRVSFFEIASDDQLHVNVTHAHPTRTPPGWMGPAKVADGFVHNRRFSAAEPGRIARHIHQMVFAARR